MEIIKAQALNGNSAEIVCPHCQKITTLSTEDLPNKFRSRVSCSCQNDYIAEVEFRNKYRIPVDLPGRYFIISESGNGPAHTEDAPHNCQVIDISRKGIGVLILDEQKPHVGDILQLKFKLDDPSLTDISQNCEVRHVKSTYVGCEMTNDNEYLGIYLIEQGRK